MADRVKEEEEEEAETERQPEQAKTLFTLLTLFSFPSQLVMITPRDAIQNVEQEKNLVAR